MIVIEKGRKKDGVSCVLLRKPCAESNTEGSNSDGSG